MSGPLAGVRIVELAGLGAAPYCGMLLADMGASVVRVDRPRAGLVDRPKDPLARSRRSIALDLKAAAGLEVLLRLCDRAEILIEGFRPGVAERLGFGPDVCLARNARLVYGRLTGWGQEGPLSHSAGHDLNYIALSGLLSQIGPRDAKPAIPLNVIGDFGGGGMLLAFGVLCALTEARKSGRGQIVDAAMLDGAVSFLGMMFGLMAEGRWADARGANVLSGASHFYQVYETSDGKHITVAALEPQFNRILAAKLGIESTRFGGGLDFDALQATDPGAEAWPLLTTELAALFRTRTQAVWCELFDGSDACVTPVLSMADAPRHPHNLARRTFVEVDGVTQNAPAPRFSRTPAGSPRPPRSPGEDQDDVLSEIGFEESERRRLREAGAFGMSP